MKITRVDFWNTSLIVNPKLAIVSAAGTHPESHYLTVRVQSDDGSEGYGEATLAPVWSGESQGGASLLIERMLSPVLIGQDPRKVRELSAAMDRVLIGNPFTKAALEMALLDLSARALKVPVHMLLGGQRRADAIPLKFSIGAFAPKEAAQVAAYAVSHGLKACKVKVGLDRRTDIERVQAVRSEVGEEFPIAVDANGGWTESEAALAIPELERLSVNVFEQPLRRGDFRGCARLRARTTIPIMLDESIFTPQNAFEALRADCCDLVSIYPGKNGGILKAIAIAEMTAAAGLECVIGSNLEMDLGAAAMLHLAVAVPSLSCNVAHDIIGPLYYEKHLTRTPIQFERGCALLPHGVGFGVDAIRA